MSEAISFETLGKTQLCFINTVHQPDDIIWHDHFRHVFRVGDKLPTYQQLCTKKYRLYKDDVSVDYQLLDWEDVIIRNDMKAAVDNVIKQNMLVRLAVVNKDE